VAPRCRHSTSVIRAKQHNYSVTAAPVGKKKFWTGTPINNVELFLLKETRKINNTTGISISSLDDDDDECVKLRFNAIFVFFFKGDVSEFDDE